MADPQVIAFPQDRMRARPAPASVLLAFDAVGLRRGGGVVLEDVGFEIAEGGVSCLLGPNGAGKSLCLRLAAGLIAPDHGGITRSVPLTKIAYVPQRPVMLRRSVRGNLGHALRLAGLGRRARRAALEDLLDLARLTHAAHQPAHSLSGGEAQRLALARALAVDPQVLLLDEPAASLDPASTAALEDLIVLTARGGTKVVLVTHDVAQARRLADDVVFLAGGRVRELAPAGRFFDRPASTAGRAYLAGRLLT